MGNFQNEWLQTNLQAHIVGKNTTAIRRQRRGRRLVGIQSHDAIVQELHAHALMRAQPLGERGRHVHVSFGVGCRGSGLQDGHSFFNAVLVRADLRDTV